MRACGHAAHANLRALPSCPPALTVQELLRIQEDTAASYKDYENHVLDLELRSMDDRYRTLDVEVGRD